MTSAKRMFIIIFLIFSLLMFLIKVMTGIEIVPAN